MRFSVVGGLAVLALLAACAQPEVKPVAVAPVGVQNLIGVDWSVFAIEGVAEVLPPKPQLRWTSATQIVGSGGCNRFMGSTVVNWPNLRFGALAATKMACLNAPGGQEDRFFKALEQTRKVRLENDQLVLLDESGAVQARLLKSR